VTSADGLRELGEAAGEGGLEQHAPVSLDGAELFATLRPADGAALSRVVTALGRLGIGAVVRGAGSALEVGNPPREAELFLSLERMAGIDELDEVDGVCHVAAGTPLASLREKLADTGWELPLDAPQPAATVGGCLAGARVGPRCLGFGLPRDVQLGLSVTLGTGERTHCGGRVVKNVTGYDLGKLYTGSLGSLGVIEAAWLRLRAKPAQVQVLELEAPDLAEVCKSGLAAARCASARAVIALAEARPADAPIRLVVELAGDAPAVSRDADALVTERGARPADPGALDAAALAGLASAEDGLRFRVSARASRLAAAARTLAEAGARLALQPGLGLLHAHFDAAEVAAADAWNVVSAAAHAGGGAALLEAAPLAAKRERDVFGGDPALLALTRSLKQRFDPHGVLNPGRFMGGL
jgi:glycolate oxidase FAD binding subunit